MMKKIKLNNCLFFLDCSEVKFACIYFLFFYIFSHLVVSQWNEDDGIREFVYLKRKRKRGKSELMRFLPVLCKHIIEIEQG